jgi:hypothetical protein
MFAVGTSKAIDVASATLDSDQSDAWSLDALLRLGTQVKVIEKRWMREERKTLTHSFPHARPANASDIHDDLLDGGDEDKQQRVDDTCDDRQGSGESPEDFPEAPS